MKSRKGLAAKPFAMLVAAVPGPATTAAGARR